MKFVFDYEETLTRRIEIYADNFANAIAEVHRRIDDEEIVLGAEDFAGGEIRVPLKENFLPQLQFCGDDVIDKDDLDLIVDFW